MIKNIEIKEKIDQREIDNLPLKIEMKEVEVSFQSESKQSASNFNHYVDQKFPFNVSQKNPVEIKKEKNQKKKNKNRFLAWCCN